MDNTYVPYFNIVPLEMLKKLINKNEVKKKSVSLCPNINPESLFPPS